MLVIHPKDRTTEMLSVLYAGTEARVTDQRTGNTEIKHLLHHTSRQERILLLGHGSERGLFSREDDRADDFDRIIVGHPHAYYLRRHGGNLVGIFCHADQFAQAEGLHGLFSGMIISDQKEAEEYGLIALQPMIEQENRLLFGRLRALLDEGVSLSAIPQRLAALNTSHSCLADFNYNSFFYF